MENFDKWNRVKKNTERVQERRLTIRARDIFWAKIGQNIGSEEYGKNENFARPILIIRKLTRDLFIGIPLTSTIKNNNYFHSFEYYNKSRGLTENTAMILQLKTYSIKRLMNKTGVVNIDDFKIIIEKSKNLLDG